MILTKKDIQNLANNKEVWKGIYLRQLTYYSKNITAYKKYCNTKLRTIITDGGIEL